MYEYLGNIFIHVKDVGSGHGLRAKDTCHRSIFSVPASDDSGHFDLELMFTASFKLSQSSRIMSLNSLVTS